MGCARTRSSAEDEAPCRRSTLALECPALGATAPDVYAACWPPPTQAAFVRLRLEKGFDALMPQSPPFAEYVAARLIDIVDRLVDVMRAVDPATLLQLQRIQVTLEILMSQTDALTIEVATLKTNVSDLATRIGAEIADLAAAVTANGQSDPAVASAIASLQDTNAQLVQLSASLAADDAPANPA